MGRPRSNIVPQKENLYEISKIPKLYEEGYSSSKAIAEYYGQHPRHGSFFLNACRILGWITQRELTPEGKLVAHSSPRNRYELTKKAVVETEFFTLFSSELGNDWYKTISKNEIELFLIKQLYLSQTTAHRRANTIISWNKFLIEDYEKELDFPEEKDLKEFIPTQIHSRFIRPIFIQKNEFDVGVLDSTGNALLIIVNCCTFGLIHNLNKIDKLDKKNQKYILFIRDKDLIKYNLVIQGEFNNLQEIVYAIPIGKKKNQVYKTIINSIMNDDKKLTKLLRQNNISY